jgi:outer membrane protein
MKKIMYAAFVGWLLWPLSILAMNVGVVDVARLLQEAPQAKSATLALQKEFKHQEKKFVALQKSLIAKAQRLEKESLAMSAATKRELEREILNGRRDLKWQEEDLKKSLVSRRNQELEKLQKLINQVLEKMGVEKKLDLILYNGVAYHNPSLDLTDAVLARLATLMK